MSKSPDVSWTPSEDGVDPSRVPKRKLYTGALMPAIGLGTFGSDHVPAAECKALSQSWISLPPRQRCIRGAELFIDIVGETV